MLCAALAGREVPWISTVAFVVGGKRARIPRRHDGPPADPGPEEILKTGPRDPYRMPFLMSGARSAIVCGVTTPAAVFTWIPGILVQRGRHALRHGHVTLQVEDLVQRGGDPALLQAVDRRRSEVDAADHDVARFLASRLQSVRDDGGYGAVLGPDSLAVRVGFQVGGQYRHRKRRITVYLGG